MKTYLKDLTPDEVIRRLKVRVWDKYFGHYWSDDDVKHNIRWLLYPDNDNIKNVIIEQCTGLKDKKRKAHI